LIFNGYYSFDADITGSGPDGVLTITHDGGEQIEASNLEIVAQPGSNALGTDLSWGTELTAGSSGAVLVDADATVRIVYAADDGSSSATLGQWEKPDA